MSDLQDDPSKVKEEVFERDLTTLEENKDLDLSFIDHPQAKYTVDQKTKAVTTYLLTGSQLQASIVAGVPYQRVKGWKAQAAWWHEALEKLRKEKQDELDSTLTNTIHDVSKKLMERLEEGDPYVKKTGEIGYMPIKMKDLAVSMAVLYDKRALIRGEATSIRKESTESLKTLENRFKEFALQLKEKDVIDTQ